MDIKVTINEHESYEWQPTLVIKDGFRKEKKNKINTNTQPKKKKRKK